MMQFKCLFIIILCYCFSMISVAQVVTGLNEADSISVKKEGKKPYVSATTFKVSTKSNIDIPLSLMEELFVLDENRSKIESGTTLSPNQRKVLLEEASSLYLDKRIEFVAYVNVEGILNISKEEQNCYLSILKEDDKIDLYKENVKLIKNHTSLKP